MELREYVFYTSIEDGEWVVKISAGISEGDAARLADGTLIPVIKLAEVGSESGGGAEDV